MSANSVEFPKISSRDVLLSQSAQTGKIGQRTVKRGGDALLGVIAIGAVIAAIVAVLFIVLGSLGLSGVLAMHPIGADIMISLGVIIIFSMISALCKAMK